MPQDSLSNQFFNGFASAVDDIRHKVVEEPFWGREVTDSGPDPRWPEAEQGPGFGSHTHIFGHDFAPEGPWQGPIWQGNGEVLPPEAPWSQPYEGQSIERDTSPFEGHATEVQPPLSIEPPEQSRDAQREARKQEMDLDR